MLFAFVDFESNPDLHCRPHSIHGGREIRRLGLTEIIFKPLASFRNILKAFIDTFQVFNVNALSPEGDFSLKLKADNNSKLHLLFQNHVLSNRSLFMKLKCMEVFKSSIHMQKISEFVF